MPFSFDPRQLPGGPVYDEKGNRPFRGVKRYGDLGRVTPGDELENTRDHERLWMHIHQVQEKARAANKAASTAQESIASGGSPGGIAPPEIWKAAVRFASGTAFGDGMVVPNLNFAVMTSASLPVGRIKANYKAGYVLQVKWFARGERICGADLQFLNTTTNAGGYSLAGIPFAGYYEAWAGPAYEGFNWAPSGLPGAWESPWRTFKGPAIQDAYLSSDEDEFSMFFRASNCSGFSAGVIDDFIIWGRWVHHTALGFDPTNAINSATPTTSQIPIGDDVTASGLTWNPSTQAWELSAGLPSHLTDAVDAHDASAISVVSTTLVGVGTDVQAVFEELDDAIASVVPLVTSGVTVSAANTDLSGPSGSTISLQTISTGGGTIRAIAAPTASGSILTIRNGSASSVTLKHQLAGGVGSQLWTSTQADVVLLAEGVAIFQHDGTNWIQTK